MMFESAEKKINSLEFRVFELERQMKLAVDKKIDDYNLRVLQSGLVFLGFLTVTLLAVVFYG